MAEGDEQRSIGVLEGKLDRLIAAVDAQAASADESRRRLYERVGKIETSIVLSGKVEAQVKDRLDKLGARIDEEVMPTINKVNGWEKMGMGALAIIGIGGVAVGSAVVWVIQHIKWPWQG